MGAEGGTWDRRGCFSRPLGAVPAWARLGGHWDAPGPREQAKPPDSFCDRARITRDLATLEGRESAKAGRAESKRRGVPIELLPPRNSFSPTGSSAAAGGCSVLRHSGIARSPISQSRVGVTRSPDTAQPQADTTPHSQKRKEALLTCETHGRQRPDLPR